MTSRPIPVAIAALIACLLNPIDVSAENADHFAKWSRIELSFHGADSRGCADPNPFAVQLNVTFTSPSAMQHIVPGFYDGDGKGGLDGDVWKVRFSTDELGQWTYRTTSSHKQLADKAGRFEVSNVAIDAKGFWKWGRLEYTGTPKNGVRYLKFRDGPYWLKAGCDDPEHFLGRYRNYNTLEKRQAAIDYLDGKGVN